MVCAERTIGSKIILDATDGTPTLTWVKWKLISVHLEKVLISSVIRTRWGLMADLSMRDRGELDWWKKDDVHGLTTTIQGRCALATDTPPPMVAVILRCDNQPLGHPSCKQSKNSQEQENKY
jgi:hypothetical protein